MDIRAFIRELLFGHDCVILPGFGGFIGNYTPASIDRNTGTFNPPVKQISFNRHLNHNDGLLVGRISKVTGLNYGDARNLVDEFVRDLNSRLSKGERIVFDHLGTFVFNHENSLQFEPDRRVNYHLDSYGLETFQYAPVEKYDVRKRILRHVDREPVKHSAIRKNLWRAAIAVPLLAMLLIIPLKTDVFRSKIDSTSLNPLVAAEFENNRNVIGDSVDQGKPSEEMPVISINDETVVKGDDNAVLQPVDAPAQAIVFSIVTGSFKSEENALDHVNILRGDGFDPEIVKAGNGFYRVHAMKCNSKAIALSRIDSIAKKFPGSWISAQ